MFLLSVVLISFSILFVSRVNLPGTDWVLVSTSDGKKYYYNSKTKVGRVCVAYIL